MKRVVITGCGFAGMTAARILARYREETQVIVIDKNVDMNFLPLLPDIIGRGFSPFFLAFPIREISKKYRFSFIQDEVKSIDMQRKLVAFLGGKDIFYDYAILTCGSETNFYGNAEIQTHAFKLDDTRDALKILRSVESGVFNTFLISGGGYTGIEIATAIRRKLDTIGGKQRIIIVERAPLILGALPEWMRTYVLRNLKLMNIEVLTDTVIDKVESGRVSFSGGASFEKAMLVWTAGVKIPDIVHDGKINKNPQGRIYTDEYLRIGDHCFATGDAALVSSGSSFLRMGVQFSLYEGACAADNVIRSIRGRKLRKYTPYDLGYIIPMANNRSCGSIMGMCLKGRLPTFLHYCMCIYRSVGLKNKLGLFKSLLGWK
ncbi:MAG: FAD-dependent oxidoreductase [Candidatus Omnitrophica bacterium]|nr:FAD-dependent oxidoreductase [Candidatus Omnitrophota bacterium]